jgi:homoserine dehydrogenase
MAKIAILGYGVVGGGFIELIDKNREKNLLLNSIEITSILVKNKEKHIKKSHNEVITTDVEEFFSADSDIIVEVMGGLNPSYEYVKRALKAKKHVVTANKDLIAEHGKELFQIANENGVALKFEAAVAGGIPIIKPLTESLCGNEIKNIKAILNGTTNFILTKMGEENLDYEEALKEAQNLGFAEANPEADVMGYDPARKLAILSTLAFNKSVDWKEVYTEGITKLNSRDFKYADKLNCKIKLVAESNVTEKGVYATVKPVLVDNNSILSKVDNEFNVIILNGDAVGEVTFAGKGAGKLPTGTAVYGDVIDIINKRFTEITAFNSEKVSINHVLDQKCKALLRIDTLDKEEVVSLCKNTFESTEVLSEDEEVALFVESKSEEVINRFIEEISDKSYVKAVRCIVARYYFSLEM